MADVQFVLNVIVYEDGQIDVICDSSVSDLACLQVLEHATQTVASQVNPTPKPPKGPTIHRLK